MKRLLILMLLCAPSAWATNTVYVSQNGAGAQDGLACASAKPLSYFNTSGNWSGSPTGVQIGPDTTVHLCGTFTGSGSAIFTIQGSGTSGHPVTVVWESGARVSQTFGGIFNMNSKSNFVFDGGSPCGYTAAGGNTTCSLTDTGTGIIEATTNGSALANRNNQTQAFFNLSNSGGIEVKNLIGRNLYVHSSLSDTTSSIDTGTFFIQCASGNAGCNGNISVHDCTLHDMGIGVSMQHFTGSPTIQIYNNYFYNNNWHIENSGNGVRSLSIHDNRFWNQYNWDTTTDAFHHNGIHSFSNTPSDFLQFWVYNNLADGDVTHLVDSTAILLFNDSDFPFNQYVFNNVVIQSCADPHNTSPAINLGSGSVTNNTTNGILNNLFIGCATNPGNTWAIQLSGRSIQLQNNLNQGFGQFYLANSSAVSGFGTFNRNVYGPRGQSGNSPYQCASTGAGSLAAWQTACSVDANSITTTNANVQTVAPFQPQTGSPLIGIGTNLTSLCATVTPLCTDRNGAARPPSGNWDVGAAQAASLSVPGIPSNLVGTPSGSTANMTWTASTGTVSSYTLSYGTTSGGPYPNVISNITGTSQAITNLSGGTYASVVKGCNSAGCSANSAQATFVIQPAVSIPSAPATLTATASSTTINLSWSASTGTPTNYIVRRGTVSGGPYTTIATLGLVTNYADTGLANSNYCYVIQASNSAGTSGNSPQACATVNVSPAATPLPAIQNFGTVIIGQTSSTGCTTSPCSVLVTSSGTANLVLASSSAVTISGANAADFAITGNTCTNSLSIAPGGTCQVTLSFTPSIVGSELASLVIVSNDPNSPDSVLLTGTGIGPVTITPTSVNFGNVYLRKTSAAQTVTYSNTSGATVTFSSIAIAGGDSSMFAISANTCGGSVANNASCTVSVTFTPTANGPKSSTLVFTDSATGSPHNVTLSGKANSHKVVKVAKYTFPSWLRIETLVYDAPRRIAAPETL